MNNPRRPSERNPAILFVNQHYWPDFAATGQNLTDLAEYLARRGYEVSVLCSQGKYLAGALQAPSYEVRNGVHIHRVRATSFGRGKHLGRLIDYASYYLGVVWRMLFQAQYRYVVFLTTPPLLGYVGALMKSLRGQPYGIWSMDLHPDAEEALGMLRPDQPVAKVLNALNDTGYKNADFVVDLGPFMKERLLLKGVAPQRLHTIPVWSDKDDIAPISREANPLRRQLGLEDKFVVMYSGNAGLAHRFDEVLGMMKALKDEPDIHFLFVGGGPRKKEILSFVREQHIGPFSYLDYFPREQLSQSLSLADVHLLTLRNDMAGIAAPGKLYGIMAAARPVLMVGPEASEPGAVIRSENIGMVIDPLEPGAADRLIDALREMKGDPELRQQMGRRAHGAFLKRYEKEVNCRAWAALLESFEPTA